MTEAHQTSAVHNVASALSLQAASQPQAAAIHYPTGIRGGAVRYRSCSYLELDQLSDNYARGLREYGIGRGVRTALMVPPGLDFFALFFALFKAGAVPVLIDPGIGIKPLKKCLDEAAPEAFIGVTRAQLARTLLRWSPGTINRLVTCGPRLGWGGITASHLRDLGQQAGGSAQEATHGDDDAAILFTSGSTGIPKGVVYRHRHFTAQVDMLKQAFGIEAGEIDLPTFPPFALFDPALGMTTVVPHMDPTRPARANPERLVHAIRDYGVTNVFGSPALIRVLGDYCRDNDIRLPSVRRVISAGAAVPVDVIRTMQAALNEDARIYTPYGATECLPVAVVSGSEIDGEVEAKTKNGEGICVGRPVAPNRVGVIPISDDAVPALDETQFLGTGEIGEIVVHGPTATDRYWHREEQTELAKMTDAEGRTWHRMGDAGYFDEEGRLWYCGRKSQRINTADSVLYADQLEAVFNTHPRVLRTALVDAGSPVLCVETHARADKKAQAQIRAELLHMAQGNPRTHAIGTVLFHPAFPVDIRHNAKIGREELGRWAAEQLR